MLKREQKFRKWNATDNNFDLVTEIRGWNSARQTLLSEMHRTNIDCFSGKGQTYVGTRSRNNKLGYITNESETTMYKLEIVRTK